MTNIENINTSQWQASLSEFGEVVTGENDIRQSIFIIISTVLGSVPYMPTFGCGLFDHIDKPIIQSAPLIARDMKSAITRWEDRVNVTNVTFTYPDALQGVVHFNIFYTLRVALGETQRSGAVTIGLDKGVIFIVDQFNRHFDTDLGQLIYE